MLLYKKCIEHQIEHQKIDIKGEYVLLKQRKNKDVVFLCQYFYPEFLSSARLPFDIAKNLVENGYSVGALCGYPKEYSYHYDCPKREVIDGVSIRRVKYSHKNRHKFFGRVLNTVTFIANSFLHIGLLRKYKCAVVISDPPILPVVGVAAKRLFKTKMVFISYDIFPEIAIATKRIRENGLFSKYMNWLNSRFQKTVDKIVALTDEMKDYMIKKRPSIKPEKISVIPNWATESVKRNPTPESYKKWVIKKTSLLYLTLATWESARIWKPSSGRQRN